MTSPTVAVVIPAWNAARFIEEAIRSALEQTVRPDTIVVADDGSTDGTADLAQALDPSVRVVHCPHEGVGTTRNAGIAASKGDLLAFLDADDLWLPTKLERQLEVLEADPSIDAVFCLTDEFCDWDGDPPVGFRAPRLRQAAAVASSALVRRALVDRLGPFPATPVGDWVGWWARARAEGVREHIVPEVLLRRRIHGANNSVRRSDHGKTFLAAAREHARAMRTQQERR